MTTLRICFVGDSITAGTGDEDFLGWPGRLCHEETLKGHDITLYNLGIRGDTSELIQARWKAECAARLPDNLDGALVFSFGVNDAAHEEGLGIRVPLEKSIANARDILKDAIRWKPVLWIGPPPIDEEKQPFTLPSGQVFTFNNERCKALSDAYKREAALMGIPYLDVFNSLDHQNIWKQSQAAKDGIHPLGEGYKILTELIGEWDAWRAWFDG
ncbi:MAG: GDSL-type esterase/lipase family protein [Rhodospirillales bacterium]|nr:GDSL-type esterase/lipase family protein [Rhodospirillales bacterium]